MQINNIIKNLETKYSLKVGKNEVNNYEIKGFKGNPTQSFCFNETDLAKLEAELNRYENWTIIGDFIGFYYNDSDKNLIIQLYLNAEIPSEWIKNQLFDGVTINMNYRHKTAICNLNLLEISYETPETVIAHIQKKALEKSNGNLCSLILQEVDFESRIDDIKRWTTELKSIFHFLIFELDYNYSIQLTNFGSKIETTQLPVKSKSIKQDTILSFKKHKRTRENTPSDF